MLRSNISKIKKSIFWDSFFFVFGFNTNPIREEAKRIAKKSIDIRIADSWEATSKTFKETFEKEECLINE